MFQSHNNDFACVRALHRSRSVLRVRHRGLLPILVLAIVAHALLVFAGPMLPQEGKLTPEERSLAGMTHIQLRILEIPPPLVLEGFTEEEIEEAWTKRLEVNGLTIAEGGGVPVLELKIYLIKNPQVDGAVVVYPVLKLFQPVEVARIGEEAEMPTYTQLAVALEPQEEMADSFQVAVDYLLEKFIKDMHIATRELFPEEE